MEVLVKIEKADSRAMHNRTRLTYEQFPFVMDMLNGREFSWRVSPGGRSAHFVPEFRSYTLSRQDMITDLRQLWQPELYPVLPEEPVGQGDTWSGEMEFEWPFANMDLMERKARVELSCIYKVKKISSKKGRRVVKIQEERKVRYTGWMHVELVSLLLDGEGKGSGEWEIDVTRGLVLSHKAYMDIDEPKVTVVGDKKPLDGIRAEYKIFFERKLDKLEQE